MAFLPDTTFISSGRGGQASQKCGFGAVPYDEKAMAPSNESGGAQGRRGSAYLTIAAARDVCPRLPLCASLFRLPLEGARWPACFPTFANQARSGQGNYQHPAWKRDP